MGEEFSSLFDRLRQKGDRMKCSVICIETVMKTCQKNLNKLLISDERRKVCDKNEME